MYDRDKVTGTGSFPVQDITHKPKRMQGDMIKLNQQVNNTEDSASVIPDEGLNVITLERAITYYKRMSGDATNGKLYEATSKWLEELLVTRTLKTKAVMKAEEEKTDNGDTEGK